LNLSDLAALGSFVSGLAVLVSLVFLYFQLRQIGAQIAQAEKNQRALMSQGAIDRSVSMNCWLSDHSPLMVKASLAAETLTNEEVYALSGIVRNFLLNFQDYHLQHRMGLADEITYQNAVSSVRYFMAVPGLRAMYRMRRATYAPELVALVDGLVDTLPLEAPLPMAESLRASLAALHGDRATG
jgi:hypothetical protein